MAKKDEQFDVLTSEEESADEEGMQDEGRPKRVYNPTEKGLEYDITCKTKLYWQLDREVNKQLGCASLELQQVPIDKESLLSLKQSISGLYTELASIEIFIQEKGQDERMA